MSNQSDGLGLSDRPAPTKEEAAENAERVQRISDEGEREKVKAQGGRTDEEIVCQSPLCVTLGGQEMDVPILAYRINKKWRDAFRATQAKQLEFRDLRKGLSPEEIEESCSMEDIKVTEEMLLDDKVDLVVLYLSLSGVGDESILDMATDQELMAAYDKIEVVATPLSSARRPKQS